MKFKKKYIKKIIRKWKEKKIMTWMLTWLNVSAAALNATFQFLVIYRLGSTGTMEVQLESGYSGTLVTYLVI